jgi:hypothetical protein
MVQNSGKKKPTPKPKSKDSWSWSDKLAIALACLAAIMALILLWMDKTPVWAAVTVAAMAALIVYPVIHFFPSWKARIPALIVLWALIGLFGWRIWPRQRATPPSPSEAPMAKQLPVPPRPDQLVANRGSREPLAKLKILR